jgi:hypothetical protein
MKKTKAVGKVQLPNGHVHQPSTSMEVNTMNIPQLTPLSKTDLPLFTVRSPVCPPPEISRGDKAKARDILAAIRTLQTLDAAQRLATQDERQALARFPGFGPVALGIFPDPVTGRYHDAGWQQLGGELQTLLTPEDYASAKRTTFTAFYTSLLVIRAMHDALKHLGVPEDATVLEARLRHRQLHRARP